MAVAVHTHLASPGRIGSLPLRNRMVVTAMGVGYSNPDGTVSERQIAYHAEQAKGGVALIITGATGVAFPAGGVFPGQMAISDDRYIPGLSRLTEAVHAHGAKLAFQLHRGAAQSVLDMFAGRPLFVPSTPLPEKAAAPPFVAEELAAMGGRTMPQVTFHEMTLQDIQLMVRQYADGARRARERRRRRDPRRPRLYTGLVSLGRSEPSDGRLWGRAGEQGAFRPRGDRGGPRRGRE